LKTNIFQKLFWDVAQVMTSPWSEFEEDKKNQLPGIEIFSHTYT
jgi:hypothetical protein